MSKSQGNTVPLSASDADIESAVQRMYTDPNHLRASDPGEAEGNVVFTYLDAFDPDTDAVAELKAHYRRGGLGDMVLKRRLTSILQATISPSASVVQTSHATLTSSWTSCAQAPRGAET